MDFFLILYFVLKRHGIKILYHQKNIPTILIRTTAQPGRTIELPLDQIPTNTTVLNVINKSLFLKLIIFFLQFNYKSVSCKFLKHLTVVGISVLTS